MIDTHEADGDFISLEEGANPTNFAMMPHFLVDLPEMTPTAHLLYHVYIIVCGGNNRCWQSLDTLAARCRMNRQSIMKARDILLACGLITVTPQRSANGGYIQHHVQLKNPWRRSAEWSNSAGERTSTKNVLGGGEAEVEPVETSTKNVLGPVQKMYLDQYKKCTLHNNTLHKNTLHKTVTPDSVCSSSDDLGFFQPEDTTPKPPSYSQTVATKLFNHLSQKNRIRRRVNLAKWAEEIRSFLVESELTRNELDPVLDWWIEHSEDDYMPQVFSVSSFIEKFPNLEVKRRQDSKINKSAAPVSIKEQSDARYARILKKREEAAKNGK